jgi:hypothetical protein
MTDVFVLRPINDEDPAWERSSHRATCQVYAESESHARALAAKEFAVGGNSAQSPWLDSYKVDCRAANAVRDKLEGVAVLNKPR